MNGFTFDYLSKYELPNIVLTNLSKKEIGVFPPDTYKGLKLSIRFNAFSEMSFNIKSHFSDSVTNKLIKNPYFDLVKKNKLILLPDIGWFIINDVTEDIQYKVTEKTVTCYSYEKILESKNINLLNGTYKFYNELNPSDESTLIGKIFSQLPSWKIGFIDEDLWNKYRTFDIPESNIYSFLMNDVEKAYECIFDFDILNQIVNIYTTKSVVKTTDIVLTFDNLIKKISIEELDTPIITALGVFGDGDLDIRNVNPIGTSIIYNFNHYYNDMSSELVSSVKKWQSKVENKRKEYSDNLSILKDKNSDLLSLKTYLVDLNSELKALEQVRTSQMPNVKTNILTDIKNKKADIREQKNLIVIKEKEIKSVILILSTINKELSFKNNFTKKELFELDPYIYESSYRNENYIKTKKMTPVDIQDMSIQLLKQGQEQLKTLSQPSYCFKMDSANFMFMKEYEVFIKALSLGCLINIEVKDREWVQPILLEIEIDYDNPSSFNLVFGNRFRLQTAEWTFADLFQENNKTTTNVNVNSNLWSEPVKSGLVNEVNNYMNNALDLSKQDIVNNKNSEVTFGEFGIKLRRKLTEEDEGYIPNRLIYDPTQVWLYNKGMGFTTDNWNTCKAFFGTITNPNGGKSTGLIAPTIVGNLVAGEQLQITNENNTFKVDSSGAELTNAKFTLNTTDNKAKITLNPTEGIKIQTNNNGWKDSFYVDNQGDLIMSGKLSALEGNIGGWRIGKDGLYNDNNGDCLKSNGYGQLSLLSWTPNSATFDGNIYARNLRDKVKNRNMDDDSIDTENICRHAVTPRKLDRVYAEYGDFKRLRADVANIGNLVADKASINDLEAVDVKIRRLRADMIDTDWLKSNVIKCAGLFAKGTIHCNQSITADNRIVCDNLTCHGKGEFGGNIHTDDDIYCDKIICDRIYYKGRRYGSINITDKKGKKVNVLAYIR